MSDACYFASKLLITGAARYVRRRADDIGAHERDANGDPGPSYRCLFPRLPPPGSVPVYAVAGILVRCPAFSVR